MTLESTIAGEEKHVAWNIPSFCHLEWGLYLILLTAMQLRM